uniref:Uncharacterized protein n=1 Tax=Aquila chrysaetos chrysaetos TaxID=223781 RepID=A0A663ERP9_AQUCH
NELGDGGVRRLCEGLRDPASAMTMPLSSACAPRRLWQCRLTEASCGALAAVLAASPSLTELHLGDNELGDGGVYSIHQQISGARI